MSSLDGVRSCRRYQEIEVEYQDMNFKKKKEKYSGWTAQIIQHEIDHCDGILNNFYLCIEEVRRMDFKYCKLEIFIPETHISQLQKALQSVDAGHIGNYDSCMSCSQLTSYWRPLGGTSPYIGNVGEISCEPEVKVEVTVFTEKVDETIQAIKEVHPYEEPVINALPIYRTSF